MPSTTVAPKLLDLRPDRTLLNPHFNGYKLTLQPLPKLRTTLGTPPGRRHASDDQYSYLHAQLFATHNHLVADPYTVGVYYYVDATGGVQVVRYNAATGQLGNVHPVYTAAKVIERFAGDYNSTLLFVSGKLALLADGSGGLSVLETGDREREADETGGWKMLAALRPLDEADGESGAKNDDDDDDGLQSPRPFVLLDARIDPIAGTGRAVHCVLLHIAKQQDTTFETVLDWVVCEQLPAVGDQPKPAWTCRSLKRLRSKCMPQYCALEAKGEALLLAGDRPFILEGVDDVEVAQVQEESGANTASTFGWHQNTEDVIVRFDVPPTAQTADFRVVTERRRVCVTNTAAAEGGRVLLDAELHADIDAGLTTWLLENETLTLTLMKAADDAPDWPCLLSDATAAPAASEFLDNGRRDAFAGAGLEMEDVEDCDNGGNDACREFFLERLNAATNQRTHKCPLGTAPPLFRVSTRAGHPAAVALRHDVDVCVWQPPLSVANDWTAVHTGTLDALGYVQASKTQKKYMQCSPDLRYTVICEPQRHVFIYQAQCAAAAGLKNRRQTTGGSSAASACVGQQRLLSMEAGEEIVGLVVDNEVTLLLTEREVIGVQINA